MKNLQDIINYFLPGRTPTSQEFKNSWESFWHKSEKMPLTQFVGLNDILDSKASKEDLANATTKFKGYHISQATLNAAYPPATNEKDFFAWVGSPYPGTVYKVFADGMAWTNTGEVPKVEEVDLTEYVKKEALTSEITADVDTAPSNLAVHGLQSKVSSKYIQDISFTDGMYINKLTGVESSNSSFCATDFLDIQQALSISGSITVYSNAGVAFFNHKKEYIEGIGTNNTTATKINIRKEVVGNIKYVRFSTLMSEKPNFFCEINATAPTLKAIIEENEKSLQNLETMLPRLQGLEGVNKYCYELKSEINRKFVNAGIGYWQSPVGEPIAIIASVGYNYMPIFSINYGDSIIVKNVYGQPNTACFAMIDAGGNFLARKQFDSNNPNHDFVAGTFKFTNDNPNCVAIGWYVDNRNSAKFPLENAEFVVNEGEISISVTDEYKKILEDTLEINNSKEFDSLAFMYNKGYVNKSFTKKKAIIVWGQSNADGRNELADAPQYIKDLNYILPKVQLNTSVNGSFATWNQTAKWSFKLITAYQLSEIDHQEIYFINLTVGGTSLAETGTTTQHWTPFVEKLQPTDTSLLRRLEVQIRACIANLGGQFDIRAIIGHQGEGDNDPISAPNYYTNLRYMIAYMRGVVGNPYLPFIAGTISHKSSAYNPIIEKAMLDVMAEDYYTRYIDLSQATLFDGLHLDAPSSESFGIAVATELRKFGI